MSAYFDLKVEGIEKLVKKINKLDKKVKCYLANNNGSWFCLVFHIEGESHFDITVSQDKVIHIHYFSDSVNLQFIDDIETELQFLKEDFINRKYTTEYLIKHFDTIYRYCYAILD